MKRLQGFTMAEIMIVIVILAVLGSLALPRFFGQTEKMVTVEAINILSAIRRAQLHRYDAEKEFFVIGDNCSSDENHAKFGTLLGVQLPDCAGSSWSYQADSADPDSSLPIAIATRKNRLGETSSPAGTLTVAADGTWGGTGEYSGPDPKGSYWPF